MHETHGLSVHVAALKCSHRFGFACSAESQKHGLQQIAPVGYSVTVAMNGIMNTANCMQPVNVISGMCTALAWDRNRLLQ